MLTQMRVVHDKNGRNRMELKEILAKYVEADKLETVMSEVNTEMPKLFIPKSRFNEQGEEVKLLKTQLEENKKVMEGLTAKALTVEEYEKRNGELQKSMKDMEENTKKQIANITKRSQLKEVLLVNNVHKDALDLLVEKYSDMAEVDEKGIKNKDDLLKKIKEEKGGLFLEGKEDSTEKGGNKKTPPKDDTAMIRKLMGLPEVK
jgi:hypothetical protein